MSFAAKIEEWPYCRDGDDQVVSVLAFYSDDPSSNPAEAYGYICKICDWKEQKNS